MTENNIEVVKLTQSRKGPHRTQTCSVSRGRLGSVRRDTPWDGFAATHQQASYTGGWLNALEDNLLDEERTRDHEVGKDEVGVKLDVN